MKKENNASLENEKKNKETKVETKIETSESNLATDDNSKDKKKTKITRVGTMLKEMRQEKGIKLSDVAKHLCIRKSYLDAIENNDPSGIPPFPYGTGFIRSYAKFLGLNSENIVDLYKEENKRTDGQDMKVLEPQTEANFPKVQYLIISVIALVLLYIGWFLFNDEKEEQSIDNAPEISTTSTPDDGVIIVEDFSSKPVAAEEIIVETDASQPTTDKQITISEDTYSEPVSVEKKNKEETVSEKEPAKADEVAKEIPSTGVYIEVLEETWVEVKDETKLYISKVLSAGTLYKVPEGKGMILSVGKSNGVNVYVNGVLTPVVRPSKKINIALDNFLKENH